jgi:ABC-2 type transport system permease protein
VTDGRSEPKKDAALKDATSAERAARGALWELTLTRWRMFLREPSAVFWTFGFPILLSIALGIAFRNRPPEPVRVAVEAGEGASEIRAALDVPDVRVTIEPPEVAERMLRSGKVSVVISPSPRAYHFDETRPESRLARLVVDDKLQRAAGRTDVASALAKDERVTEPGARYIDFLLPGLIGMSLMSSGMWGIGYLIVEMRTRKLIKRMVATPMRRGHFLLSFVFMRMLVLVFELPILLGFGRLVFGVQVHGSYALLAAVVLLGAVAFSGLGLLVASRAENTQTAGGLINLVMLPMFMCSGVFFSSHNFPMALQPFIGALPLTALNDALRAVMNEGAGARAIAMPSLVLALCAAVSFTLALRIFRWR